MSLYSFFLVIPSERRGDSGHRPCPNVSMVSRSLAHLPRGGVAGHLAFAVQSGALGDPFAIAMVNEGLSGISESFSGAVVAHCAVRFRLNSDAIHGLACRPGELMNVPHQAGGFGFLCFADEG